MRPTDLLQFTCATPETGHCVVPCRSKVQRWRCTALWTAIPLSIAGFLSHEDERTNPRHHLFVLDDKEQAAYFMNDLQSVLDDTRPVLLYPCPPGFPTQRKTPSRTRTWRCGPRCSTRSTADATACASSPSPKPWPNSRAGGTQRPNLHDLHRRILHHGLPRQVLSAYEFGSSSGLRLRIAGQYSMRGGIVDIFSYSFDHPYRPSFLATRTRSEHLSPPLG